MKLISHYYSCKMNRLLQLNELGHSFLYCCVCTNFRLLDVSCDIMLFNIIITRFQESQSGVVLMPLLMKPMLH